MIVSLNIRDYKSRRFISFNQSIILIKKKTYDVTTKYTLLGISYQNLADLYK